MLFTTFHCLFSLDIRNGLRPIGRLQPLVLINEREEKRDRGRMTTKSSTSKTDSEGSRPKSLKNVLEGRPYRVIVRQGKGVTRKGYEDRV